MKLRTPRNPERRIRGKEMLVERHEDIDLLFDPKVDIPQKIWREVDRYLARESDPGRDNRDQALLRIALLDPERARIVQSKPFFGDEVRDRILRKHKNHLRSSGESNLLMDAAEFQAVSGSMKEIKTILDSELDFLIERAMDSGHSLTAISRLSSLVQLYPEQRDSVIQRMTEQYGENHWKKCKDILVFESENQDYMFFPSPAYFLSCAANVICLFPEYSKEVLNIVQPFWSRFKRWLQESSDLRVTFDGEATERKYEEYAMAAVSMNFLAETAKLQNRKISKAVPLPDRLAS